MRLTNPYSVMGRKYDLAYGQASTWKRKLKNNKYELIENAIDKLGELENIEDDLSIDLITLHKCFKSTKFYVKNLFNEIIEVKSDNVRFDIGNGYVYFGTDYFPLSSYGKTWALTKEELL